MKHYTSIEQSKKLLELGLKSESADMCYPRELYWGEIKLPIVIADGFQVDWTKSLPCWSVGALLELIPSHTEITKIDGLWTISSSDFLDTSSDFIIDALVDKIQLLLENNNIEKEE